MELIQTLLDKGITVHVLNMGLPDNTPTGKLIQNIMLAFAEFECDMIVERTREGKAIAKRQPDFKEGRPLPIWQKTDTARAWPFARPFLQAGNRTDRNFKIHAHPCKK